MAWLKAFGGDAHRINTEYVTDLGIGSDSGQFYVEAIMVPDQFDNSTPRARAGELRATLAEAEADLEALFNQVI